MKSTYYNSRLEPTVAAVSEQRSFYIRAGLRRALVTELTPRLATHFECNVQRMNQLAEALAFLPTMGRGFRPREDDFEVMAEYLVAVYLAHVEAFAAEGFTMPDKAALKAMADIEELSL